MLPVNGALPRHIRSAAPQDPTKNRWQRCYVVSLTLFASAILATLVTFGVLNFLLNGMTLPPVSTQTGLLQPMQQPELVQQVAADSANPPMLLSSDGVQADASIAEQPADAVIEAPVVKPPPSVFQHPFDDLTGFYKLPPQDTSPRCKQSQICDGDHSCGPDNLGCVTSAQERKQAVRKAIAWAWEGYRKYAWGHDEVDVLTKSPHAWFNLGLTIVDSLDTLLIAGLDEEYHQARHWVANHLVFHDGSNVQFFEVNIRILGGLISAYYLSGGDDLYMHKAEMLSDRLLVAFNTSSGLPVTFVPLRDAAGRAKTGMSDANTNIAEAGTISMEFTSIGRLLGRDDLFEAGQQFWYVLMASRNFSGLYCMGIHTSKADCYNPSMTIGSAADSTYEYMLKQWIMSNHTQGVPLELYKSSMAGVRKYLVRHVWDGQEESSIVSEAKADIMRGTIGDTNNRFEHLTCFAGGMFVLGALHDVDTAVDADDFDDVVLGARIGRACYELYHQAASGLAPDSVTYKQANGSPLPPRDHDTVRVPGIIKHRPGKKSAAKKPTGANAAVQQPALPVQAGEAPHAEAVVRKALDAGAAPHDITPAKEPGQDVVRRLHAEQQHGRGSIAGDWRQHSADPERSHQHLPNHHMHALSTDHYGHMPARERFYGREASHVLEHGTPHHMGHEHYPGMHHPVHDGEQHGPRQLHYPHHPQRVKQYAGDHPMHRFSGDEAGQHRGRHLMAMADEGREHHGHAAAGEEVLLRMPQRRLRQDHELPADRPKGDGEPERKGIPLPPLQRQPVDEGAADVARARREREAAIAAQQQRFPEAQRAVAQREAEARQQRQQQQAASRLQQQQLAAQQQQVAEQERKATAGHAPGERGASPGTAKASQTEVKASSPSPPSHTPPSPPSAPPPPAGPVTTVTHQMTPADFLRPETVETLFYLWRATGDEIYREWGWNMFRAFERWTRRDTGGYATVTNVNSVPPGLANKMESFFLAETLKYFYLLFEDDPSVLPLDQWVFNTEAHPLPIWGTPADKQAMARLKQRRHAAKLERKKHEAEEEAVAELRDIKQQGAALAQHAPQLGKPADRQGYGLGGVEMY